MKNLLFITALFIASCGVKTGITPPNNDDAAGPGPLVYGRISGSELGTYIPYSTDTAKIPTIATQNYVLGLPFLNTTGGSIVNTSSGHKLWVAKYNSGQGHTNAPSSLNAESQYIHIGGREYGANTYRTIGFGYNSSATDISPVALGIQEKATSGSTNGDLIFATRSATSNTAPLVRFRITTDGQLVGEGAYTPSTDQSLATKKYIDALIKTLQDQLESLKKQQ